MIGKLPAHGDFIARGVFGGARDSVDAWLAQSGQAAREAFGEDWQDRFDLAPPWRFVRPDANGGWEAGAIAPSVDKVGRRFPLLLWRTGLSGTQASGAAEAAEQLAYEAIAGGWDADRLHGALGAAMMEDDGATWDEGALWWTVDADGARVAKRGGTAPEDIVSAMLACVEED